MCTDYCDRSMLLYKINKSEKKKYCIRSAKTMSDTCIDRYSRKMCLDRFLILIESAPVYGHET